MKLNVHQYVLESKTKFRKMFMNSFPDLESAKKWLKDRYYVESETYWGDGEYLGYGGLVLSKTGQLFRIEEG